MALCQVLSLAIGQEECLYAYWSLTSYVCRMGWPIGIPGTNLERISAGATLMDRALDDVVLERAANWYLNLKTFPMSEDQFISIVQGLRKPYRHKISGWKRYSIEHSSNYKGGLLPPDSVDEFVKHLKKVLK